MSSLQVHYHLILDALDNSCKADLLHIMSSSYRTTNSSVSLTVVSRIKMLVHSTNICFRTILREHVNILVSFDCFIESVDCRRLCFFIDHLDLKEYEIASTFYEV